MEPIDMLDAVHANAQRIIDLVGPDDHARRCPCEGWDVATLLDKMVTSGELFAVLCRGDEPGPELNLLFPTAIGRHDPSGSFAEAASRCREAFAASNLEGEMVGPLGVMVPRRAGLNVRMMDCTINTWDLAQSIGVDHGIADEIATPLVEFVQGFFPKVREKTDHVRFAPPLDVSASSPADQLVALSGRDPSWSPESA